jgi:hypothetical protein
MPRGCGGDTPGDTSTHLRSHTRTHPLIRPVEFPIDVTVLARWSGNGGRYAGRIRGIHDDIRNGFPMTSRFPTETTGGDYHQQKYVS